MDILVVDDDLGTCETLASGLRLLGGHDVVTAQDAEAALAFARSRAFEVVLIDQRLGQQQGIEIVPILRGTISRTAAVYILTAWGTIPDAVEAMRVGATDYLEKQTVDIELLVAMLGSAPTPKAPTDPRVRTVLAMITARPTVPPESLADAVELSVSRLRALFRAETGIPLKQHQREARLDRAAFLIRTTVRRISDVANTMEFQDLKRFERLFRGRFGCVPSEYTRRSNRPHK